jgi:hypothetical protein
MLSCRASIQMLAAAFAVSVGLPALAQEKISFAVTDVDGMELSLYYYILTSQGIILI